MIKLFAALTSIALIAVFSAAAMPSFAAKAKFERTKPHVNVATAGSTSLPATSATKPKRQRR